MQKPTAQLYYTYEKEFKKAVGDTAKKYWNLRLKNSDYIYDLNVYALEALRKLDKCMTEEDKTSAAVIGFLKGHLNKRAIDLWRRITKPCRKCRKNKPKTPMVQPCGCIIGGPRWLPINKDNPVFMSDTFKLDWTKLVITATEQDLLDKWCNPEFRDLYPAHKNIMKDIANLCDFYSLEEAFVTGILTALYEKLKDE